MREIICKNINTIYISTFDGSFPFFTLVTYVPNVYFFFPLCCLSVFFSTYYFVVVKLKWNLMFQWSNVQLQVFLKVHQVNFYGIWKKYKMDWASCNEKANFPTRKDNAKNQLNFWSLQLAALDFWWHMESFWKFEIFIIFKWKVPFFIIREQNISSLLNVFTRVAFPFHQRIPPQQNNIRKSKMRMCFALTSLYSFFQWRIPTLLWKCEENGVTRHFQ